MNLNRTGRADLFALFTADTAVFASLASDAALVLVTARHDTSFNIRHKRNEVVRAGFNTKTTANAPP